MDSFTGLLNNSALMLILCILYDTFNVHAISNKKRRDTVTGMIAGLITVAVMLSPWSIEPGVFFDTRWVLLSLCGLFFGFTPTMIAVFIAGAFRLYQGGTGGVVGTIVIITTASTGLAWRYYLTRTAKILNGKLLYLFGVTVQLVMLSCMFLMPRDMIIPIFKSVALPVLTIYPFLTLIVGLILLRQEQRRDTEKTLAREIAERKTAEHKVLKSHKEWENTFNSIPDIVTLQDTDFKIIKTNQAGAQAAGMAPDELIGHCCHEVFMDSDSPCESCPLPLTTSTLAPHSGEIINKKLKKIFQVSSSPVMDDQGRLTHLTHVAKDITAQKKLEGELFQAQKMESIGTLAGGIAHDFNNILSAIMGYAELAKINIPHDSKANTDIDQIIRSGQRAADLVRQILTFSRKSDHYLEPLHMHVIVRETMDMLRASLPTTIEIKDRVNNSSGRVMADPTNIQQIVINLCTNAVHAMENEKGRLSIRLYSQTLSLDDISADAGESPGSFVVLEIADTGCGMSSDTLANIFEPYFTTKEVGKGTGLGLSVIHGIVKDYKGFIRVQTRQGEGSTFQVFFPALKDDFPEHNPEALNSAAIPRGDESILLVDDEIPLLKVNSSILKKFGYTVSATARSKEALEWFRNDPDRFDLVISDQTMPEMTGIDLAREILLLRPKIPVIICTGYSAVISEEEAAAIGVKKYVSKPVGVTRLAQIIRTILDNGS
jgi:PAS domain S-box-containing protein